MSFRGAPKVPNTRSSAAKNARKPDPRQRTLESIIATSRSQMEKENQLAKERTQKNWGDREDGEDDGYLEQELALDESSSFLARHELIDPTEPVTNGVIARALVRIAEDTTPALDPVVKLALTACAHLLQKIDASTLTLTDNISSAISSKLERHFDEMKNILSTTTEALKNDIEKAAVGTASAYRDAAERGKTLNQVPFIKSADIDPRTRAREATRQRQVLLDINKDKASPSVTNSALAAIVAKANEAIKSIDATTKHAIRAARRLDNGGIILEASNDEAARWITENSDTFTQAFDEGATVRKRTYTMIARFVPINFDPASAMEELEIISNNDLPQDAFASMRWIKAPERRAPNQQTAHLILKLNDPTVANHLAVNGLIIHHQRISVEREQREPLRCFKCQGWDHMANTCTKAEYCGKCGRGEHKTRDCTNTELYCTPCGTKGHASGDRRSCPIFKQKLAELNARIPENTMPYIPTDEPWTHAAAPKTTPPFTGRHNTPRIAYRLPYGQRQNAPSGREPPPGTEQHSAPWFASGANTSQLGSRENSLAPPPRNSSRSSHTSSHA